MTSQSMTVVWHHRVWLSYDITEYDCRMTSQSMNIVWHHRVWLSYDVTEYDCRMTSQSMTIVWHHRVWLSYDITEYDCRMTSQSMIVVWHHRVWLLYAGRETSKQYLKKVGKDLQKLFSKKSSIDVVGVAESGETFLWEIIIFKFLLFAVW